MDLDNVYDNAHAVFRNNWLEKNGNMNGCDDAWQWWCNPDVTCSISANKSGGRQCARPCQFCIIRRKKRCIR